MAVYGYIRVSSTDQNEDRQLLAMEQLHISKKNVYMDKQSGKDFNRPQYRRILHRPVKYQRKRSMRKNENMRKERDIFEKMYFYELWMQLILCLQFLFYSCTIYFVSN